MEFSIKDLGEFMDILGADHLDDCGSILQNLRNLDYLSNISSNFERIAKALEIIASEMVAENEAF